MVGRRIVEAKAGRSTAVFMTKPKLLEAALVGKTVQKIDRHGKYLLVRLNTGSLLVHLGMTGNFGVAAAVTEAHQHLRLRLDSGTFVAFRDPRTFGRLCYFEGADSLQPRLARLGPDALNIDAGRLWGVTRKRTATIKSMLLDQSVFAGIGNIYCDEALFLSGVRPSRRASKVTKVECQAIAANALRVLHRAIELGGSSISDFVSSVGESGYFQIEHKVYGRGGEPCVSCGTPISKGLVAQRGTHWCRKCQK